MLKTLLWGQTIFTSHQVKQLLNGRDHLWMSDQRILRYQVKSLLMKVKEESEKVGWKLNSQKTKFMASGPITSWEIDGETVSDFIFWGSKITADGDCSHEIKICLLLGRKIMTNLDSILKSRDITLSTGPSSQSCDFSSGHVWMWEFDYKESWVQNWCFWTVV